MVNCILNGGSHYIVYTLFTFHGSSEHNYRTTSTDKTTQIHCEKIKGIDERKIHYGEKLIKEEKGEILLDPYEHR